MGFGPAEDWKPRTWEELGEQYTVLGRTTQKSLTPAQRRLQPMALAGAGQWQPLTRDESEAKHKPLIDGNSLNVRVAWPPMDQGCFHCHTSTT